MSGKSEYLENASLALIFQGKAIAGLADNAATGTLDNLYIALHTDDPEDDGDQSTNEVVYTGYARVPLERSEDGWIVTGSSVSPAADVVFPEMTAGTAGEAKYASIGTAATGAGNLLYTGKLTPSVAYDVGVEPKIRATSSITED